MHGERVDVDQVSVELSREFLCSRDVAAVDGSSKHVVQAVPDGDSFRLGLVADDTHRGAENFFRHYV